MKLVFGYLKKHIGIFLLSMLFLVTEAVADLLQPTFMSYIVDRGVAQADLSAILRYGAIMLLIAAVGALGAVMRNLYSSRTSQLVGKELRADMYRHVQELSLENIDKLQSASVITRITNDVTQIQDFINSLMRIMGKAPITCVGAITLILLRTPKQAPVMLVILVLCGFLIYGNIRLGYPRFGRVQKKLDALNGVSREYLNSVRVVKAFTAEDEEEAKFEEASVSLADANVSALRAMAVFSPLINLSVNFGIVLLLWLSSRSDVGGIGRVMASVSYMTQVLFSLGMITNVINTAVRAAASAERIEEVLAETPAQDPSGAVKKPVLSGSLAFEHVSFRYRGAAGPALCDVSFSVKAGETLGIIGPTGSGKTTLIDLVPRLYDATEGRILLDGTDVREIDTGTLRAAVGLVPQRSLLFTGTVEENVRWGDENASREKVERACRTACAEEFILSRPEGYEAMLGQGGVNLSGGQKQRLSLARALVREPRILILDDCTSALDAATEASVLNSLQSEAGVRTVLLISQRISTVRKADKILCLDNGRVQGFGTHEELLKSSRVYRAIYRSQIGGDENE